MSMLDTITERWPITIPQTVAAGIVCFTVLLLGSQVWRWQAAAAQAPESDSSLPTVARQPENTLPILLSANLFGTAQVDAAPTTASGTIAASNMGFTLRASFAAQGASSGGAIIETSDGQAHWYALNATIPGGVILQQIHPDHVVLNRSGNLEKLAFPPLTSLLQSAAADTGGALATPSSTSVPEGTQGPAVPIPVDASAEEKAQLIRQRLEELRNRSRT